MKDHFRREMLRFAALDMFEILPSEFDGLKIISVKDGLKTLVVPGLGIPDHRITIKKHDDVLSLGFDEKLHMLAYRIDHVAA